MGNRDAEGSEYKSKGCIYRSAIWETKGKETAQRIKAITTIFLKSTGTLLVFHVGANSPAEKAAAEKHQFLCVSFENSQRVK